MRVTFGGSAAFVRFYGELNDFLPPGKRGRMLVSRFNVSPSIKDAVESLGVPHPEIELLVANHTPVDFSYALASGDYVSVFPPFTPSTWAPFRNFAHDFPVLAVSLPTSTWEDWPPTFGSSAWTPFIGTI